MATGDEKSKKGKETVRGFGGFFVRARVFDSA
jgi:hypothetical protein